MKQKFSQETGLIKSTPLYLLTCAVLLVVLAVSVLSAVTFGVMHWNVVQFLYAGILGLLLAWLLERTGFLYAPVLAHIGANVMAVVRSETGWLDFAYQPTAAGVAVTVLLFAVAAFAVLLVKKGGVRQEEEKTSAA